MHRRKFDASHISFDSNQSLFRGKTILSVDQSDFKTEIDGKKVTRMDMVFHFTDGTWVRLEEHHGGLRERQSDNTYVTLLSIPNMRVTEYETNEDAKEFCKEFEKKLEPGQLVDAAFIYQDTKEFTSGTWARVVEVKKDWISVSLAKETILRVHAKGWDEYNNHVFPAY